MERPSRVPHSSVLIGIGLVLIGLLAGVLVMLFADLDPAKPSTPRVVERVQLGRQEPSLPVPVPKGGNSGEALADVMTLNRIFKQVAQHVTPAVVYIQVEVPASRELPRDWFHNFNEEGIDERFFREMPRQSVGSGVIISDQGYIVTNNHVVDKASEILITLADKRQFKARLVGVDPSTDLAVLKVESAKGLPVVALGDSDALEVGEWVLAVGNPFRLTSTVTAGIVSALARQVNIIEDEFRIEDFIQTDAAINPGNSGGALVNLQGELVGISTAIATESGSYEGYGFAVPANLMERIVQDLIAYGEVQRGYLGVTIQEIDAYSASRLGLEQVEGVYIDEVWSGGSADRAGLRNGDVVLSVEERGIGAPNELQSALARHRPGDQVAIEVWRRGRRQQLQVELLGRDDPAYAGWFSPPAPEDQADPAPDLEDGGAGVFEVRGWGLGLRELTEKDRDAFEAEQGVYLASVEKGSVAAQAGLPRDVVVQRIGEGAVTSLEDAVRLLQVSSAEGEAVLLRIKRRNGLAGFYEIEVPAAQ